MIAVDRQSLLLISGTGDVVQPTDNVAAVGSGGSYALAAARALVQNTDLDAKDIVRIALEIGRHWVFRHSSFVMSLSSYWL